MDAPWPPVYPKQPNEPPRVAPSRAREGALIRQTAPRPTRAAPPPVPWEPDIGGGQHAAHRTAGRPGNPVPMMFRPETAKPLNDLAEVLLRGDSTLTRGERETIAAYVSQLNSCNFCHNSHATFAALQLDGGWDVVDQVMADPDDRAHQRQAARAARRSPRRCSRAVRAVTDEAVQAARAEGATDVEIHDTVLIAAAFCMFNRYVDGLGTIAPPTRVGLRADGSTDRRVRLRRVDTTDPWLTGPPAGPRRSTGARVSRRRPHARCEHRRWSRARGRSSTTARRPPCPPP